MNINNRIKQVLDYYKISPTEAARRSGIKTTTMHGLTTGRNVPRFETIEEFLAHFTEIDGNWLITGQGEMFKTGGTAIQINQVQHGNGHVAQVGGDCTALQKEVESLREKIESLQEQLRLKDEIITLLRERGK